MNPAYEIHLDYGKDMTAIESRPSSLKCAAVPRAGDFVEVFAGSRYRVLAVCFYEDSHEKGVSKIYAELEKVSNREDA